MVDLDKYHYCHSDCRSDADGGTDHFALAWTNGVG
jgi:hypothetical protein